MFGAGLSFVQKYEPLGLLYIAAVLRQNGFRDVSVIDAYAEELTADALDRRIENERPDVVGFSVLTCGGKSVFQAGQRLKKKHPGIFVVLGNIHAGVFAEQYLRNGCCDAVVHGEGEYPFLEIVRRLEKAGDLADVKDISFIGGTTGEIVTTGRGGVVQDLAALPFPARDLVKSGLYNLSSISNQLFIPAEGRTAKTMITSRGCPYACSFCAVHDNRPPRYNEARRVVDEMQLLRDSYKADYVYIMDPLFMAERERLRAICGEIRRRGLKLLWGCDARVDGLDGETLRMMENAGCFELSLGIESGTQRVLDGINKRIRVEDAVSAVNLIKKSSGILVEGLFMLGLPGETEEEMLRTIEFACSLPIDMAQFSIFTPYPGSRLFKTLSEEGGLFTGVRKDGTVDISHWERFSSYVCFTGAEPAWAAPGITPGMLVRMQKKAFRDFYLRPAQLLRHLRRLRRGNIIDALKIVAKGMF